MIIVYFAWKRHLICYWFDIEAQNVRNLLHPVRIRWIKLSNLAIFIYITGYLDVRKMSETLVFRTFVGALQSSNSIKELAKNTTHALFPFFSGVKWLRPKAILNVFMLYQKDGLHLFHFFNSALLFEQRHGSMHLYTIFGAYGNVRNFFYFF